MKSAYFALFAAGLITHSSAFAERREHPFALDYEAFRYLIHSHSSDRELQEQMNNLLMTTKAPDYPTVTSDAFKAIHQYRGLRRFGVDQKNIELREASKNFPQLVVKDGQVWFEDRPVAAGFLSGIWRSVIEQFTVENSTHLENCARLKQALAVSVALGVRVEARNADAWKISQEQFTELAKIYVTLAANGEAYRLRQNCEEALFFMDQVLPGMQGYFEVRFLGSRMTSNSQKERYEISLGASLKQELKFYRMQLPSLKGRLAELNQWSLFD